MGNKKISALTELTAIPADTDVVPVVDVSDTSDAPTGTTKRVSVSNLLSAGSGKTYTVSAVDGDNADEEKIRLTDNDGGTDDVVLEAGTGLSISRTGDKITFTNSVTDTDTVLTTEQVQDIVGAMVSGNTETNIAVTYDDAAGKLDFSSTDTDTTYSVVTSSAAGLAPQLPSAHGGKFLKADGTWEVPPDTNTDTNTTYSVSAVDGDNADEEKIRLTDSGGGTDDVVLEAGTGLSIARDGDKITFTNTVSDTDTVLTTEQVQDIIGGMVSGNTETNIAVTYDDANGKLNFSSTDTDTTYSVATTSADGLMSSGDKTKLDGIASGAEVNVQSDWNSASGDSQILNKPTIPADLGDLDDVSSTAATTGQVLKWNGSNWGPSASGAGGDVNQNAFSNVAVSGETTVAADTATDTLTLVAGTGISLSTNASTDSVTITNTVTDTDTVLTTEQVQDIIGDMVSSNTETNISVTYDDANGKLNFSSTDTDTTYSVVTTSADGLAPQLPSAHGGKFLKADGTWEVPPDTDTDTNTTYSVSAVDGDNADEEKIRLTDSGGGTDDVVLEAGTGLSIARTGDKITFTNTVTDTDTVLTTEQVQDIIGAMVSGNTETNIAVTYDDTNGKLNFSSTDTDTTYSVVTTSADGLMSSEDKTKLDGVETGADVTDTANVTAAGALMDSEVDADIKTLSLPASTTISDFGKTLVDDADAAAARTTLGAQGTSFTQDGTGATARTITDKLKDVVSVKDFGATGDNSTDDSSAIQAAIDAVGSSLSDLGEIEVFTGAVFLPSGRYKIDSSITLKKGVHLIGESQSSVLIRYTGSGKALATSTGASDENQFIWIRDLTIEGAGKSTTTHGLHFNGSYFDSGIERVSVTKCAKGIELERSWMFAILKSHFYECADGGVWDNGTAGLVSHTRFDQCDNIGLTVTSTANNTHHLNIIDSVFQRCGQNGLKVEAVNWSGQGLYFEYNNADDGNHADLHLSGGSLPKQASVRDSTFIGHTANANDAIYSDTRELQLIGCFVSGTNYDSSLNGTANQNSVTVIGGQHSLPLDVDSGTAVNIESSDSVQRLRSPGTGGIGIYGNPAATDSFKVNTAQGREYINFEGATNQYVVLDTPAGRRNNIIFKSDGVAKFYVGRGDSDDVGDDWFYVDGTDNDTSPSFGVKTDGRIRFAELPTSASGLSDGEIWNDNGVVQLVGGPNSSAASNHDHDTRYVMQSTAEADGTAAVIPSGANSTRPSSPLAGYFRWSTTDTRFEGYDGSAWSEIGGGTTHTGEVTGSGALTIANNVVDEANLKISNAGTDGQFLQKQSGNTGGLTWAEASGGVNGNLIVNGAMQVYQRGASQTGHINNEKWPSDRFVGYNSAGGQYTVSNEADAPTGFARSSKFTVTTANSSPSYMDLQLCVYRFEGQDLQQLCKGTSSAKKVTLSFWVKSNVTGTYIAELQDKDNDRTINKSYTVSSSGTWEKKEITFDGDTSGALDNDANLSLEVVWWLMAGQYFTSGTLQTSWDTKDASNRAVGQTNLAASTGNYWQITGVKLEVADAATDYVHSSYGEELASCKRYFQKLNGVLEGANGYQVSSIFWQFPVEMRAAPTITQATGSAFSSLYTTTSQRFGGIRDSGNRASIGDGSTADAEL